MADDSIAMFTSITGQSPHVASRYLEMAQYDAQKAIELFFESPDLASGVGQPAPASVSNIGRLPPLQANELGRDDGEGVIHIDSDDDVSDEQNPSEDAETAAALARATDYDDDEAMARRMQEELYAGGDAGGGRDADDIRAPIARTRETLVGGSDANDVPDDMHATILQQMRARQGRASARPARPGIFNQILPSVWDDNADPETNRRRLAQATGGASSTSSKAAQLGEAFRPPFELMCRLSWDAAREKGKDEGKWIMVNIQNNAIFDCQNLNRDLWKYVSIKEVIRENFIFMQYSKDDPSGSQYIQYYFPLVDSNAAFPHIAIVDPRTGEQVKVWSGPPNPEAGDFLMQLFEFLDRYSLDVNKKNPVAKRKPEKPKSVDVDRLTEQEMLDIALKNSLAADAATGDGPKEYDPDDLTKSFGDVNQGKGKGKTVEHEENVKAEPEPTNGHAVGDTPFINISATVQHMEPAPGPDVTRIQFKHSKGRVIRRFSIHDPVRRIYEWLKSAPLEGYQTGARFDLKSMGKDLVDFLDVSIDEAQLKNGTVMVEYTDD